MTLVDVAIVLIVIGVLLWLANKFLPMEPTIKSIMNGVVIIATVLWLLGVFGLWHHLSSVRVG